MAVSSPLDHDEQLIRMQRIREEIAKAGEEQRKLWEESRTLAAEQQRHEAEAVKLRIEAEKLDAERIKIYRDYALSPIALMASTVTGTTGLVLAIIAFAKLFLK